MNQAEVDEAVGAIVVTGAGRGWCPGADLAYRPGDDDQLMYESLRGADVVEGISSFLEKRDVEFARLGHGTTFEWWSDTR